MAPRDATVSYKILNAGGAVVGSGPLSKVPPSIAARAGSLDASGNCDPIETAFAASAAAYDHGGDSLLVAAVAANGAPCPGFPKPTGIYVDPSGTVQTLGGQPVVGATVTLARSDTPSGPFVSVLNGVFHPRVRYPDRIDPVTEPVAGPTVTGATGQGLGIGG